MPGSRVIVADATKRFRGNATRSDLVLELFREPLEIDQICQWQKCSPHWEEQSIKRVFHSSLPGSRVIVADATKRCRGMETRSDLVLELSRETLEIDQICQLQRLSLQWEEQSINRVFHFSMPGSRVISSYCCWCNKKMSRKWNPLGPCAWIISRTIRDRSKISIRKMFASLRGTIY